MSGKTKNSAKSYLTLNRMVVLSLVFSVGFHLLFLLAFFFGESLFVGSEKASSKPHNSTQQIAQPTVSDMPRVSDAPPMEKVRPIGSNEPKAKARLRMGKILVHIALSFVLVFVLFLYNRKMMGIVFSKKWREIFFVVFGSILITTVLSITFSYLNLLFEPQNNVAFPFRMIRDTLVRDYSLMAVVVMACYLLRALYHQRMIAVENEELRTENLRSHYEALKKQLDPHFLFNSMNTLQSLIDLDKEKAGDYVQQLSSVLRYTLQNKEVVTLSDEMACVRDYCAMMQIRYGDNLKVDFQVDEKYDDYKVLPFAVQGLVENAIKHNIVSSKQPLVIQIVTDEEARLKVSNPRQPKIDDKGSGIGLANLAERYRLQWNKDVLVSDDGTRFEVILQLIEN